MQLASLTVGYIETNCYVVADENTRDCAIIDPGAESQRILDYVESNNLKCRHILLTHGHSDHVDGVAGLLDELDATVYMSEKDNGIPIGTGGSGYTAPEGTVFIKDGDTISVGGLTFKVMETPGHTPGCVCFICEDAIFSGDTLFRNSCGRTDFTASNPEDMMKSLARLAALDGDYEVFPGHMGNSTLERERRNNYYMLMALEG